MNAGGMTVGGILGAAAILAGGVLVIRSLQDRKKPGYKGSDPGESGSMRSAGFRFPEEGYVVAVIIGITRNLRAAGAEEGFHVICRYVDEESGAEVTYTSGLLREYPGKEIIGKCVRVYLDPKEAEHYSVDLTSISDPG